MTQCFRFLVFFSFLMPLLRGADIKVEFDKNVENFTVRLRCGEKTFEPKYLPGGAAVLFTEIPVGYCLVTVEDTFSSWDTSYIDVFPVVHKLSNQSVSLSLPSANLGLSLTMNLPMDKRSYVLAKIQRLKGNAIEPVYQKWSFLKRKGEDAVFTGVTGSIRSEGNYRISFFKYNSKQGKGDLIGRVELEVDEKLIDDGLELVGTEKGINRKEEGNGTLRTQGRRGQTN